MSSSLTTKKMHQRTRGAGKKEEKLLVEKVWLLLPLSVVVVALAKLHDVAFQASPTAAKAIFAQENISSTGRSTFVFLKARSTAFPNNV